MGESAPSSPGRGSPPAVDTPLVAHGSQEGAEAPQDDVEGDCAMSATDLDPPPDADSHYVGSDARCDFAGSDAGFDEVGPEPGSPTARTPLVHTVSVPEAEPELTMGRSLVQGAPVHGAHPQAFIALPGVEPGFPASYLDGSRLTICTPLMETKSDTCSYNLPPTAGCSGSGGFDTKSETNSYAPLCRICHMSEDDGEPLISPCRCSGTLQHIHNTCLMRWLEILTKKSRKPPKCELCHFQYHRHKKFKFQHWRFPRVSRQDKILHVIFIINLVMMIGCAVATVMSFLSDEGSLNHTRPGNNVELSTEEIITLSCGVLFFVSFFIAMSVQIKAKHTIYQLLVKFIMQNMEWEIDEYDKSKDTLYKDLYKGLPVYV